MLEVQNNAARKTGDAEVIQHLPALMVRNALDRLVSTISCSCATRSGTYSPTISPLYMTRWRSCCVYGMLLSRNSTHKGSSHKSSRANHVLECSRLRLRS